MAAAGLVARATGFLTGAFEATRFGAAFLVVFFLVAMAMITFMLLYIPQSMTDKLRKRNIVLMVFTNPARAPILRHTWNHY